MSLPSVLTDGRVMKYVPPKIEADDMKKFKIILIFFLVVLWGVALPLYETGAEQGTAKKAVVIDPGHGGSDNGVRAADKTYEKDYNLRLALALQRELLQSGFSRVVLTRIGDVDLTLKERIRIIKNSDPLVVIGLHTNAGFGGKARGYELYFPGFGNVKETRNEPSAIISDMTKNKHLNDSVRLSQQIQKHLGAVFPRENRGLREAPLPLLAGLNVPAVIIEIGFLTNKENRQKLVDESGRQEIARAIAKGVKEGL